MHPTAEDVRTVLKHLPSSAPGPDGIRFSVLGVMPDLTADIIKDVIDAMLCGNGHLPDEFNFAYLVCLPKSDGQMTLEGETFYEASETRRC